MILYDVEYICLYTWFFGNCFIPLFYTLYIQICKNCNIHNFTCYFAGCDQFTYCAYDREISNRWFGKFVCFIAWEGSPYVEKGMTQSTIGMLLIFSIRWSFWSIIFFSQLPVYFSRFLFVFEVTSYYLDDDIFCQQLTSHAAFTQLLMQYSQRRYR